MKTFWGIIIILSFFQIFVVGRMLATVIDLGGDIKAISIVIAGYIPFGILTLFSSKKFSKLDWSDDLFYLLFKNLNKVTNNISKKSQNKLDQVKNKLRDNIDD